MRTEINHDIDNDPKPEDAGTIRVTATIFGDDDNFDTPLTTRSLPIKDFLGDVNDEDYECPQSIQELNNFLMEAKIDDDVIDDAMINLVSYVDHVTCSTSSIEYTPECALEVQLDLFPHYLDDNDDDDDDDDVETINNTRIRPASKLVVQSLTRKIYNKKMEKEKSNKECTICLEEFSSGAKLVTLPCGHDFDDECMLKWLETSHVCPLCRFELPCEDQLT